MKFSLRDLKALPAPLIGVDEVGRGCLAGPVTAAAVIFRSKTDTRKYKDSKALTAEERDELSLSIHTHHLVGIGWATVEEIDRINILQASFLAMRRAIESLQLKFDSTVPSVAEPVEFGGGSILVDGRDHIPECGPFTQRAIIGGDARVSLISAASIAAKVARDRFMQDLAREIDGYGFEKHKGYGTPEHRRRIQAVGPCKWHRQSFAGVKEHIRLRAD